MLRNLDQSIHVEIDDMQIAEDIKQLLDILYAMAYEKQD